ncbi:hypothetical protein [Candidatus Tisiphia endosymbiont of Dioctria rufipes]|uniref:hypothetical protein n=1 Tax=Candidatus Tisiphia endosymbiont of Dioctria rufipes TaxID=3066255 RepID=UPI00312CC0F4
MACKDVRLGWKKKPFKYGGKDFLFRGLITYPNGKVDEWTYLATWDPQNLDKKIYIREDEVLKQIEEVFKRIGNKTQKC